MKKSLLALMLFVCPFAFAQTLGPQMSGATINTSSYTGAAYSYGFYGRNQAAGTGTSLWDGYGNYGIIGAAVAQTTGTEIGTAGVAAFGAQNIGLLGRATQYKAGVTQVGAGIWAENRDAGGVASGKVVGLYVSLENAPRAGDLEPDLTDSGATIDTEGYDVPALILREHGADVLTVPAAGQLQLHTAGRTQPTCDAAHRGAFWFAESGVGVADRLEACGKDQTDAYVWKAVALF